MNQILFFIIGIALLFVIPFVYFLINKIIGKNVNLRLRIILSVVLILAISLIIAIAANSYFYIINIQDNIVSERYVKSLLINASDNNIEKHLMDTEYISYVDVDGLYDAFTQSSKLKAEQASGFAASEKRWMCQDGFVHHYLYVESCGVCFDVGLLKKDDYWDVASIMVLTEEQKKQVLLHETFLKQ